MYDISLLNNTNGFSNYSYSSNPMMSNSFGGLSFGLNPFDTTFFGNDFMSAMPSMGYFNYFSSNLSMFDMYMNNQMSLPMQQNLFTKSYNTKTDLPSLKDVYNPELANKLANIAENTANRTNTVGWCAKGTNDALEAANITGKGETRVSSAYQEAERLANHKNFKAVSVNREDLKSLPAGCVICWNKKDSGNSTRLSDQYGHIAITLGDGKEASDHTSNMLILNSEYRVFVPVGINKSA